MAKKPVRGVLMYAHDNGHIWYSTLAVMAAALVRRNMGMAVALCGDSTTLNTTREMVDEFYVDPDELFYDWIEVNSSPTKYAYANLDGTRTVADYYNRSRLDAYDHSPFDHTLMLDVDYLVFNDSLINEFNNPHSVAIPKKITSIYGPTNRVHTMMGLIPQRWATALMFKKDGISRDLFDLARYVTKRYDWFSNIYRFSAGTKGMFRNDFVFSVAAHILNGQIESDSVVGDFINPLMFAWDHDLIRKTYHDGLLFESKDKNGRSIPIRLAAQNVHVMNKASLSRYANEIIGWGLRRSRW